MTNKLYGKHIIGHIIQERMIVAQNLINALEYHYPHENGITNKAIALGKDSGIGKSSIMRATNLDNPSGLNMDSLVALAVTLDLAPYQLLIPYLNIKNPQTA